MAAYSKNIPAKVDFYPSSFDIVPKNVCLSTQRLYIMNVPIFIGALPGQIKQEKLRKMVLCPNASRLVIARLK